MSGKECSGTRRKQIVPKIDNKAPHYNASAYLRPYKWEQYMLRIRRVDRENLELLKKMNVVYRLGVSIVPC